METIMKRDKKSFSPSPDEAMRNFRRDNDIALLARKTGHGHNVLLDRLNPERDQKLGYLEAIGHSHLTNDIGLLEAWAADLGYIVYKKPAADTSAKDASKLLLKLTTISGELADSYINADEDGIIEQHEADELISILDKKIALNCEFKECLLAIVTTKEEKRHA